MRKIKILLSILAFNFLTVSTAQAVNIGPFSVTIGFCQNVQKIGSIVNSYTQVQWPTTGYPGITMGLLSQSSALITFCEYITQLEQLNTQQAVFFSANYLNTLTGKKWDDHLQQADRTFNLANSVYDFENGEARKGAFESAATHREINDFYRDTKQWSSKTFNGKDADVRTRAQRESDMQKFAGAAYRRAIIKDMVNCPEQVDSKNYGKIYESKVRPREKIRDDAREDYMFFKERLLDMAPRFASNEGEMADFVRAVENMEAQGVTYEVTEKKMTQTTSKASKNKTGSDGKPSQEKSSIKYVAQTFKARVNDQIFSQFNEKYAEKWKSYTQGAIISNGAFGLLDDPEARFNKDFQDLNYECQERKLMSGYSTEKGDYELELEKRKANCLETVKMDVKKAENLLSYYVTQLKNSVYRFKSENSYIWSLESEVLGRTRVVTSNTSGDFKTEEVKCSENLTPAEMDKVALKQMSVNNELNEIIAKEAMKSAAREEEDFNNNREYNKEATIRSNMIETKSRELKAKDRVNSGLTPLRGGIGGSNE